MASSLQTSRRLASRGGCYTSKTSSIAQTKAAAASGGMTHSSFNQGLRSLSVDREEPPAYQAGRFQPPRCPMRQGGEYNGGMTYRKTAHSVYSLKCPVVWVTQYGKPVLRGEIAKRRRELVRQTGATWEVSIDSGPVAADHVQRLLSVPPDLAVSELGQRLKGRTSRLLLVECGELNKQFWGKPLWARGYFAASAGPVSDELINQSIESQSETLSPPDEHGKFSVGD